MDLGLDEESFEDKCRQRLGSHSQAPAAVLHITITLWLGLWLVVIDNVVAIDNG